MPGGNLNKEIFLNTVKSDVANGTTNAEAMLKRSCPELSDAHCEDIIATIIGAMNMSEADKVSLVVTAPPSFSINARTTMNVVQSTIFAVCREVLDEVLDTSELDRVATRLQDQALGMAERVRKLVEENARVQMNQEEYQQEYNALADAYEKASEKLRRIADQKQDKADRRQKIEVFLRMLEQQEEYPGFDPYGG